MFNKALTKIVCVVLLLTVQSYATSQCSTGIYKTLTTVLSKDVNVHKFCNSLPSNPKYYKPSTCPNRLKSLVYKDIQTFCSCLKKACAPPACAYGYNFCPKTCGGSCAKLKSDSKNCGKCGVQCTGGKQCVRGSCVLPQSTTTTSSISTTTTTTSTASEAPTPIVPCSGNRFYLFAHGAGTNGQYLTSSSPDLYAYRHQSFRDAVTDATFYTLSGTSILDITGSPLKSRVNGGDTESSLVYTGTDFFPALICYFYANEGLQCASPLNLAADDLKACPDNGDLQIGIGAGGCTILNFQALCDGSSATEPQSDSMTFPPATQS